MRELLLELLHQNGRGHCGCYGSQTGKSYRLNYRESCENGRSLSFNNYNISSDGKSRNYNDRFNHKWSNRRRLFESYANILWSGATLYNILVGYRTSPVWLYSSIQCFHWLRGCQFSGKLYFYGGFCSHSHILLGCFYSW